MINLHTKQMLYLKIVFKVFFISEIMFNLILLLLKFKYFLFNYYKILYNSYFRIINIFLIVLLIYIYISRKNSRNL